MPPEEVTKEVSSELTQSVADSNFKTLADGPAFFANALYSEFLSHNKRINALQEKALANSLERMGTTDPIEATGLKELLTGNSLAQRINELTAAVAAMQGVIKGGQTTPPVTP